MRLGYTVDGVFYDNKIKAMKATGHDHSRLNLYWCDNVWDTVDWTKEPKESWNALIQNEAKRIRDNYDHVAIWYSGGFDSQTVLHAFLSQGLRIDELIIYRRAWVDHTTKEWQYALSLARHVKDHYFPQLKITAIEKTADDIIAWYLSQGAYWIENNGDMSIIGKVIRRWEHEHYRIFNNKTQMRSIYIEGRDKPRLDIRDGIWYMTCDDRLARFAMDNHELDFNFFWNVITPQIHVKQTHMMINWLEENFDVTKELVHKIQSHRMGPLVYESWNLAIGRVPLTWHDARYGVGLKGDYAGGIKSIDSECLAKHIQCKNKSVYNTWKDSIKQHQRILTDFWDHDANDFITVTSKGWPIRPVKIKETIC